MPVGYIALIFGIFGLIAAYTIQNDIKRGVTWDQWTFALDQNPICSALPFLARLPSSCSQSPKFSTPLAWWAIRLQPCAPFFLFITDRRQA
jgi:hypothetical protein